MIVNPEDKGKTGIYCITNTVTGKVYIGKSLNIGRRIVQHLYDLRQGRKKNENEYFLNAWNKYGETAFRYHVLEYVTEPVVNVSERELYWINKYNSVDRNKGYNLRRDSSSRMIVHLETRAKQAGNLRIQWASGKRDNHSQKLTANWQGNAVRKEQQSLVLRKVLTKYTYYVVGPDNTVCYSAGTYQNLVSLGIAQSSMSAFHRQKSNCVVCKGYIITRFILSQLQQV